MALRGDIAMVIHTKEDGITFPVHKVEQTQQELTKWRTTDGVNHLLYVSDKSKSKESVVYCSDYNSFSVAQVSYHPLIASVHLAFSEHRPLTLSPDVIWIAIVQGLAQHVNNHSELLREKFVSHSGKLAIQVEVDGLFANSPESAWDVAISSLSEKLFCHIGDKHRGLVSSFSTTGINEKLACEIALLDTFQSYFEYIVMCICGIPQISLTGNAQDWRQLREKVELLEGYELDWWLPEVKKIVDQFVRAVEGDVDTPFWQNIYKRMDAYGGDIMNGWILKLIPYLKDHGTGVFNRRNPLLEDDTWPDFSQEDEPYPSFMAPAVSNPVTSRCLPSGLCEAPFRLIEGKTEHHMQFVGGFIAIEPDANAIGVKPRIGWAVRRAPIDVSALNKLGEVCELRPAAKSEALSASLKTICDGSKFVDPVVPGDLLNFFRQCDGFVLDKVNVFGVADLRLVPLSDFNQSDIVRLTGGDTSKSQASIEREEKIREILDSMGIEDEFAGTNETPWLEIGSMGDSRLLLETDTRNHRVCRYSGSDVEVLANSFGEFLEGVVDGI